MTRSVECVLVGTGAKASNDAIAVMKELVRDRFRISPLVLDGLNATRDNVAGAVEGAARRCAAGGLFVLMFSGHGGFDDRAHFWQLSRGQLQDHELLGLLGHFDLDVEIVVISDCCYGAGMLRAGLGKVVPTPRGGERLELAAWQREELERQLTTRLHSFMARATALEESASPLAAPRPPRARALPQRTVVMAAATDWLMIRGGEENRFVRALCQAVPRARTYGTLRGVMESVIQPDGQSNWIVDAEPLEALELAPLAP